MTEPQNLQSSGRNQANTLPRQQREESKISTLKLSRNSSLKRINIMEFKQNVQKELDAQKRKLDQMSNKPNFQQDEYFSNVYGPLTHKLNSIKMLRDIMQRNKQFDECHFAIGCPCFHHQSNNKIKKLFADFSWFNGKNDPRPDREMMPSYLDGMISPMFDDIPIDETMMVGEITPLAGKKKKSKVNMLRERFNEILFDVPYPDIEKKYRLAGVINKPTKGKISLFSFFEIEPGDILKFEFENKGVLAGKQMQNKIDFKEMSQFYIELIILEQDTVQDLLKGSSSGNENSFYEKYTSVKDFVRRKQSHFNISLLQKQRHHQYSYDAIEQMRQMKNTDPNKLLRMLTTYDPIHCESIISLTIIIRDIALLNFIFQEILTDSNFINQSGFSKFVSIEIIKGFQKVPMSFEKDKKFFLQLQKKLAESSATKVSDFFSSQGKKEDELQQESSKDLQFRRRLTGFSQMSSLFSEYKNMPEIEFCSVLFRKMMKDQDMEERIENIDLFLEYYRDLYFTKFVLPDKFENNSYQCIYFGNASIAGGRTAVKHFNKDPRYYNILHHFILNKKNVDDIIRRYDETFILFEQKDSSGNNPGQLLFRHGTVEQITEYIGKVGQDSILQLSNNQGENALHYLLLNRNIPHLEDAISIIGHNIINILKNQKNHFNQYPILYFLKTYLKNIKFPILLLLIPQIEQKGDIQTFIKSELIPIINASVLNSEVMLFLMNRISYFKLIYQYPPAITKFYDYKNLYEKLMTQLIEDQRCMELNAHLLDIKQISWIIDKDRLMINKMQKYNIPLYDFYVRKRQDNDQLVQESIILNRNSKLKKKNTIQNLYPLKYIKISQRTEEILKLVEVLPIYPTNSLIKQNDLIWSNKVFNPHQDKEIRQFLKSLFDKKVVKGKKVYTNLKFYNYDAQKYFFLNQENYEAKKKILFQLLERLEKGYIFQFKQCQSAKFSHFIKDLHKVGFMVVVEIKARPFVRFMPDQPIIKKEKWFQTDEEFRKIMIQKHCNHLTNIPFQLARDDKNKLKFAELLQTLLQSPFQSNTILDLFFYHIIEGNAYENLRILSKYYFNEKVFLRWCRELKINPSTQMIQVILDEKLIPTNRIVQYLCFKCYSYKKMEYNVFTNLDVSQIQIEEESNSKLVNDNSKQKESSNKKAKLVISQQLFDLICVMTKLKHFTKSLDWANYIVESSFSNRSRLSAYNKRYILGQNWPELWTKVDDLDQQCLALLIELQRKQKEKVQYKTNTSQSTSNNNKNVQQVEKKSTIVSNKEYIKKCINFINQNPSQKTRRQHITARIAMLCISLGKPKWATKIISSVFISQQDLFPLFRYYTLDLASYKSVFVASPFANKDKSQVALMDNLKSLGAIDNQTDFNDSLSFLKKIERNESFSQIQQWIQRCSEEYKYTVAVFLLERYIGVLISMFDNPSSAPRKLIKKNEESLLPEKYRKRQQEYTQKLALLYEKNKNQMTKFKKEHSYNLINHKDEQNKVKQGSGVVIPAGKSLKSLFGQQVSFSVNVFQMEQLVETCIEILHRKEEYTKIKQFDTAERRLSVCRYMVQKPERIISIIQKMKFGGHSYIKMIFNNMKIRMNKKFSENIDYLSSKLIIKEYITLEKANSILETSLSKISLANNNSIISQISKIYGKDVLFAQLKNLNKNYYKNILPSYLIEFKNWLMKEDQKNGVKKQKQKKGGDSEAISSIESASIGKADQLFASDSIKPAKFNESKEEIKKQSPEKGNQKQQEEEDEEYDIEYEECYQYHIILMELAQREAMKMKLLRQSKKPPTDGKITGDVSQFQSDLLNFDLSKVINQRDLTVKIVSNKSGMIFAEYLLSKGLLFKSEQIDERLIQAIEGRTQSLKYVIQSQDSTYAKAVFDKFFQGKRSLVEQFMDENKLFFDMIQRGSKEDFIDRMLSYYYRKNPQSLKLVELAIQNNMQKVFFSLIRSEADRNQIKNLVQSQYQYMKAFRHYDILNFALTELEIHSFANNEKQSNTLNKIEDGDTKDESLTFLLECSHVNWISMKLLLIQENQVETFNKTQKMFFYLKQLLAQNQNRFPQRTNKNYHINSFIQLSELVFERSKNSQYVSDFSIIQSEILREHLLHLPNGLDEQSIIESKNENPGISFYRGQTDSYTSHYQGSLKSIFKKPYQLMYWLKYRHNQSHLQIESADDEQFIQRVREIINKYGFATQQEFHNLQRQLGLSSEMWLFEEHIKFLDINQNENYVYQLINSFNPLNNLFPYFMFTYAIYNANLFIRLLPKLYTILTPIQVEELLALIVQINLNKSIFRLDNQKKSTSKQNSQTSSPRAKTNSLQTASLAKSQFASGKEPSLISQLDDQIKAEPIDQVEAQEVQLAGESKGQAGEKVEKDDQSNIFKYLKNGILFNKNQNNDEDEDQSQQQISSLLELQNALIILIKSFDANYYSKVVCDNFDNSHDSKFTQEKIFDIKFIVFILSQVDQNTQINCIRLLSNKYGINLKNCIDIRAFEQIIHFYYENLKPLYQKPFNVKRIEVIYGAQNKYQYFSSQNMIITLNYCSQSEFDAFKSKEFEITEQIDYKPIQDVNLQFKLKVSSKNFANNQVRTAKVIQYFQNNFQQEMEEDIENLRDWCEYLSLVQKCRTRNIDLFSGFYKDRPSVQSREIKGQGSPQNMKMQNNSLLNDSVLEQSNFGESEIKSVGSPKTYRSSSNSGDGVGSSLEQTEIVIIAKEISSSEYLKLISPYERVKNMNGQLFMEKELKNDNQYFCYFYFDGNKQHIVNTFLQTNIEIIKIIKQTKVQIPSSIQSYPTISPKEINEQISNEEAIFAFEFEIDSESIKSVKNQVLVEQYCSKYLRQELYTSLRMFEKTCKDTLNDLISAQSKIKFICIEGNESQTMKEQKKIDDHSVFILGFDFSDKQIKITNPLLKLMEQNYKSQESRSKYEPIFLTQFNSIYEIYNYKVVVDFVSYFNTITMNCSQLKLMFTYIPNQIEKAIKIISQNCEKYGFKYILFAFATTNQPYTLKSDCFSHSTDRFMRFGCTTYEIIKPLEDADSSKFKLQSQVLKVTLSLAFKYASKEITAPEKKEDDTDSYFYKVTNEFDLIKSVCSYRDIMNRLYVPSILKKSTSKQSQLELSAQEASFIKKEEGDEDTLINGDDNEIQETQSEEQQQDLNKIFSIQKFDSIIGQLFENNQKPGSNEISLLYKQAFERMKQMEIYFLLYNEIDLDIYKSAFYEEKYSKYLLSLMTKQNQSDADQSFQKFQRKAYKLVAQNSQKIEKEILKKLYKQINVISPQTVGKNVSYRFNKDCFQIVYPEPKVTFTQTNAKMIELKNRISTILYGFNISYKNEDKWTQSQWNAVIDSCEGFSDAVKTVKLDKYSKSAQTIIMKKKRTKKSIFNKLFAEGLIINQGGLVNSNDKQKLKFEEYFTNIQLSFSEGANNNNQQQQNQGKKQKSDNIRAQFKNLDNNLTKSKEDNVLQLEIINISESLRQESCLNVFKAIVSLLKNGLVNTGFAPQQEHSKNKVLRITVQPEQKEPFFKFKKKVHDMGINDLIQTYYLITQIEIFTELAVQAKKQIKIVYQYGLKKAQIIENQHFYKIRLSSFYAMNVYQLILNDIQKPIPKCGIFSINCLTQLKLQTVADVSATQNWEIQAMFESSSNSSNKYSYKNIEVKNVEIDQIGSIKFQHEDASQNQPIIIKYYYKKENIAVYVSKQ